MGYIYFPLLVMWGLALIGAFMPALPLWGVNHLAFYPVPVRIAALAVMLAALLPPVHRRVFAALATLHAAAKRRPRTTEFAVAIAAVAAIVAFASFRSSTYLLGDGQLVANTVKYAHQQNVRVSDVLKSIHTRDRISPGASTAYLLTSRAYTRFVAPDPVRAVQIFNAILGGVLVLLLLSIAFRGTPDAGVGYWLLILALFSGTMQLFFGYVEFYPPMFFLAAVYTITAMCCFLRRVPLWVPVIVCIVCAYVHVEGILLIPSLTLLIVWRLIGARRPTVTTVITVSLGSAIVLGATVAGTVTGLRKYFLPLTSGDGSYSILAPLHWIDIGNELVLLVPAVPLIVSMAVSIMRKDDPADDDAQLFAHRGEVWQFALLLMLPLLLYIVFFDPEIGFNRDWDLFAVITVGLVTLSFLVVDRYFAGERARKEIAGATVGGGVAALILTVAWVGINASPDRSMARFERLLDYDSRLPAYNYENLARAYREHGYLPQAIAALEKACDASKNPRQRYLLAMYYYEYKDVESTIGVLQQILVQRPAFVEARQSLIEVLYRYGRYEELVEASMDGVRYNALQPKHELFVGIALANLGYVEDAKRVFIAARERATDPAVISAIDDQLQKVAELEQGQ